MADIVYTEALAKMMDATIDLDTAATLFCRLVMTNSTAGTDEDSATWGAFGTDDEMDGANYPAGGIVLANNDATAVVATDRGKFDADDVTFSTLGAGTRNVLAAVIVKYVDGGDADIPIFYIDSGFNPPTGVPANGGDFKITWHADGIAYSYNP
jgi:hypothetical protein